MKLILTDIGASLASEGFITGVFPKITKVKIGDGGGSSIEHKIEDTNLINVVYEAPIISGSRDQTTLNIIVNIPVNIGGFTVTINTTSPYKISSWPIIRYLYRPDYIVWVSPFRWGYYPRRLL